MLLCFREYSLIYLKAYHFNEGFNDTVNTVIKDLYDLRKELKAKHNPAEQAFKLFMNSMYGIKLFESNRYG